MGCLHCGLSRVKPGVKEFSMKQVLIERGFTYTGACNCHGGKTEWYENSMFPNFRMEIGTTNYWVRQRQTIQWQAISYGNQHSFDSDLNKYFPL